MSINENIFESLLEQSDSVDIEGKVLEGTIKAISDEFVTVDIGLKSEGNIPLKEYENEEIAVGQTTNVYVVFVDNFNHDCILSHNRAKKEEIWHKLEKDFKDGTLVEGTVVKQVKGGLSLDINGVNAFLPGSQIDSRLIGSISSLVGTVQECQIIKLDLARGDIVVSRKFNDKGFEESAQQAIENIKEGDVVTGIVKNITNYGAFISLGSIDGLLHLIDMSWTRINHPQEVLNIGDKVNLMVIKVDSEKRRVNLGLKQLTENPWKKISERCKPGTLIEGVITNVSEYGAFVEIEKGVEGLIHVSEISWTKNDIPAADFFKKGEKIQAIVLDCNVEKRRIALSLKQLTKNPWNDISQKYEAGMVVKGEITNIDPARGISVKLDDGLEGMIGLSNISWSHSGGFAIRNYNIGDSIDIKVLEVNLIKGKLSLSIKHLTEDPFETAKKLEKGQIVTCIITNVLSNGLEISVTGNNIKGFIPVNQLSSVRSERNPERFSVGERVDAAVVNVDNINCRVNLSIRMFELDEKKRIIEEYGSTNSGNQLGDILGSALDETKRRLERNLNINPEDSSEE